MHGCLRFCGRGTLFFLSAQSSLPSIAPTVPNIDKVEHFGVYGLLARGTLLGLVGAYLVNAAWRRDPRYSGGMAGALGGLRQQPYGEALLAVMAIGLLC